jgi:flagellar M-ring protein FliF
MPNALKLLYQHLVEIWHHFGKVQKMNILVGLGLAVAVIAGLLIWSARPEYRLLYSGLSLEDSAAIKDKLDEEQIKLDLRDGGTAIYVKQGDLYRSRLTLAASGLPRDDSASAGFEIFEEPKFGLTDFAQRINYQRALQGELQRTISSMRGVDSARVMLVIPKEGLLATDEEKKSRASILLHMDQGYALSPAQVHAVVQLVSGSVKNLTASDVTITDQNGKLLTTPASGDPDAPFEQANDQLATKEKVEQQLMRKAQDILDRSLGLGQSVVKIDASMNFDKVERRSEKYDKQGRVAKSEVIESSSSETPAGQRGGLTGVRANIPIDNPAQASMDQGMAKTQEENIKSDYLVPTEVQHIVERGARLTKLSVSVAVAMGPEPRSEAELMKIRNLVSNAVGIRDDGMRQDTIEVVELPFASGETGVDQWWTRFPFGFNKVGQWGLAAIVLLVAFLVMRNVMSNLTIKQEDTGVEVQQLTGEHDEDDEGNVSVLHEEVMPLTPMEEQLQQIASITQQNPRAVAAWITSVVRE